MGGTLNTGKHGNMGIGFDRPFNYAGELVSGNLYLNIERAFECKTIELTIEVQEFSNFLSDLNKVVVNKQIDVNQGSHIGNLSSNFNQGNNFNATTNDVKLTHNSNNHVTTTTTSSSNNFNLKVGTNFDNNFNNNNGNVHTTSIITTAPKPCVSFRTLFKNTVIVSKIEDNFLSGGQYAYPFTFALPNHLPGSFEFYDEDKSAYIKYFVTARVVSNYGTDHNLNAEALLIVRQQGENFSYPTRLSNTSNIRSWCFFQKGTSTLNLSYPKNSFCPGEQVIVDCEVVNTHCEVAATSVTLELYQQITLRADNESKYINRCIARIANNSVVVSVLVKI